MVEPRQTNILSQDARKEKQEERKRLDATLPRDKEGDGNLVCSTTGEEEQTLKTGDPNSVVWGKSLNFSEPWFPCVGNGKIMAASWRLERIQIPKERHWHRTRRSET